MLEVIFAASSALLPIRILACLALLAVILVFVHVFRHLKQIEHTISADNLVPAERGPRNNLVLMTCAVPIVVVSILTFLILNA